MRGRNWGSRRSGIFILLFFVLLAVPAVSVSAEEPVRTVRVAFPEQEGMSFVARSGKITGYTYDYLQKISEYTGWNMEYVVYPDEDGTQAVSDALNDLMDGKVDLLGPILKNEQTEKLLDFPENSYGTVYTTLCAQKFSNLRESNFNNQKLVRVGLWKQAETRNGEVIQYLDAQNITYEITYYDTYEEQMQALQDGAVDVVSSVSLSPVANTRIVAQFAARSYYFATWKGNTELAEQIDAAIETINQVQPNLQETLFQVYFRDSDNEFVLSKEQRLELAAEFDVLHVLCLDGDAPYVYAKDGEPRGMLISILKDFAGELGIPVDFTFCASREEAQQKIASGTYDMLVGLPFVSTYCAENGFVQSEPMIVSGLCYVHMPGRTDRDSIAIVRGLEELIDTSDFSQVLLYDSAEECIQAVLSGRADVAAGDRSVMEYYIYESGTSLTTSLISGETQEICIGASRSHSQTFLAALNNYIYSLSDAVKTMYLSDGNVHYGPMTIRYFVRMHPAGFAAVVCGLTLLLGTAVFLAFYLRQINRKNTELRVANDAKSEFLMRISHDIRTPMNGIIGMLNVADENVDKPDEVRRYHEKIRVASDYLLSLINDVLDMSRMETKQIELEDRSVYLHQVVKSCIEITKNRAAEAGVTLDAEGLHEFYPPRVYASELHVRQILLNLISNSIKYNKPGGRVTVHAEVTEQTAERLTCRFTVSDTGIGMSEEFQKRMFEPFAQEHAGARGEFKGTGLGLAIVQKIVKYKKGDIQVKSVQGEGTEIAVTLTFRIDEKYKDEVPAAEIEQPPVELYGMRILAAEDNEMNAEILQLLLENAGAEVTLVSDGRQLVDAFAEAAPGFYDCILTDIMMPELDGYEAARAIRVMKREDASSIPIVALTANAFAEDAKKAVDAGMNAHITKPFDVDKLKACLSGLCGGRTPQ